MSGSKKQDSTKISNLFGGVNKNQDKDQLGQIGFSSKRKVPRVDYTENKNVDNDEWNGSNQSRSKGSRQRNKGPKSKKIKKE